MSVRFFQPGNKTNSTIKIYLVFFFVSRFEANPASKAAWPWNLDPKTKFLLVAQFHNSGP